MLKLRSVLAITLLLTGAVQADDAFNGEASVGFLNTTGNTSARTLNAKIVLGYRDGAWGHTGTATALNSEKQKVTTDERYGLGYKATYDITPKDYAFGSLNYENDRFSGITERKTEAIGYGRHLLSLPKHILDAEIGAGLTQQKLSNGENENSAVALLNGKYQWLISDTSKFTQTLKVERGSKNTFINPLSELKLVIAGNLFTTIAYEVRNNSDVPAGTYHTDTLTSVNLGYTFGKEKK